MDNLARRGTCGADAAHDRGVIAIGHKADVLAVGLGGHAEALCLGDPADFGLGHPAQRKAQIIELRFGGGKQEIALVAGGIESAVKFWAACAHFAANIMSGCQAIGPKLLRHGEQIGKLRPHIAADAGDRSAPGQIIIGEALDHLGAEGIGVIEHIMRDPQPVGHGAGIADVIAGAARALAAAGGAVIIQLECDADNLGPAARGKRGHHRAVDPAGHGNHDPLACHWFGQLKQLRP